MKTSKITQKDADKEISEKRAKGLWTKLIEEVKKDKVPIKVEDISRGQVSACYRAASAAGLKVRANYKKGYVIISV